MESLVEMETNQHFSKNEFWNGRTVFITGGTGFVGSWLTAELLKLSAELVILVRDTNPQSQLIRLGYINQSNVINGSLEDFTTLERAINEYEVDTVFHIAAQPIVGIAERYPLHTFESNIRGSYNLLEACRIHSDFVKRIIIASSDKAYGEQSVLPYTEDMPLTGRYPYEVSKSCTDLIAQSYSITYDLPIGIARCGNIYGGGDLNWSRIIPGTIRSLLRSQTPVIRSDGKYKRDYVYIRDICRAFIHLAESLERPEIRGQAFNFSPESEKSVLEVVKHIQVLMGCENIEPIILSNAQGEIHSQYLSSSKAQRLLDWKPQYNLNQGLVETIEWYREFLAT